MQVRRGGGAGPPGPPGPRELGPGPAGRAAPLRRGRERGPPGAVCVCVRGRGSGRSPVGACARARACEFPRPRGNGCCGSSGARGREGGRVCLRPRVGSRVLGRGARPRGDEVGERLPCVGVRAGTGAGGWRPAEPPGVGVCRAGRGLSEVPGVCVCVRGGGVAGGGGGRSGPGRLGPSSGVSLPLGGPGLGASQVRAAPRAPGRVGECAAPGRLRGGRLRVGAAPLISRPRQEASWPAARPNRLGARPPAARRPPAGPPPGTPGPAGQRRRLGPGQVRVRGGAHRWRSGRRPRPAWERPAGALPGRRWRPGQSESKRSPRCRDPSGRVEGLSPCFHFSLQILRG